MQFAALTRPAPVLLLGFCLLFSSNLLGQESGTKHGEAPPLATIGGQAIFEDDLLPLVQAQLYQLHTQEYEIKSRALENLINQRLLEAEAKKRGIASEQLIQQEADAKVAEPSEAEIQALYIVQKDQLKKTYEEIRPQLQQLLKQAKTQQARREYYKHLREQSDVTVLLKKPTVEVAYDPSRIRGNPKAKLVILEFSDFQCPYCQSVEPTLKHLLEEYDGQVSLAYRDFPLRDIHPLAQNAAEAGRCAGEQGKFWEYHDVLFAHQNKLSRDDLVQYAKDLSLDGTRFDSCLSSGKYKAQIEQDLQLGLRAGLNGTPGFIINGTLLSGNLPQDSFEKAVRDGLSATKQQSAR